MGIVVAIIFGVAGLAVGVFAAIYPVRKQRREIEYWQVSDAPIVTLNDTMASRIQVLLDGKPAEHARLRVIEVRNIGNTVRSEDYFEPLIFEFDEEVIGGEVLDTGPKNPIKPSDRGSFLTLGPKSVQFPLFPLRQGEAIRFSVLLKGQSKLSVRGRIDGTITEFDPLEQTVLVTRNFRLRPGGATIYGLLMFLIGAGLLLYFSQNPLPGDVQVMQLPYQAPEKTITGNTAWLDLFGFLLAIGGILMLEMAFFIYLKPHLKTLWRKIVKLI